MDKEEIKSKIKDIIVERNDVDASKVTDTANFKTDLYMDSLYEFDEDNYNYWREIYNSMSLDNSSSLRYVSRVLDGSNWLFIFF